MERGGGGRGRKRSRHAWEDRGTGRGRGGGGGGADGRFGRGRGRGGQHNNISRARGRGRGARGQPHRPPRAAADDGDGDGGSEGEEISAAAVAAVAAAVNDDTTTSGDDDDDDAGERDVRSASRALLASAVASLGAVGRAGGGSSAAGDGSEESESDDDTHFLSRSAKPKPTAAAGASADGGSGCAAASAAAPRDIPGFYFDAQRNKYFALPARRGGLSAVQQQLQSANAQHRQRQRQRQQQQHDLPSSRLRSPVAPAAANVGPVAPRPAAVTRQHWYAAHQLPPPLAPASGGAGQLWLVKPAAVSAAEAALRTSTPSLHALVRARECGTPLLLLRGSRRVPLLPVVHDAAAVALPQRVRAWPVRAPVRAAPPTIAIATRPCPPPSPAVADASALRLSASNTAMRASCVGRLICSGDTCGGAPAHAASVHGLQHLKYGAELAMDYCAADRVLVVAGGDEQRSVIDGVRATTHPLRRPLYRDDDDGAAASDTQQPVRSRLQLDPLGVGDMTLLPVRGRITSLTRFHAVKGRALTAYSVLSDGASGGGAFHMALDDGTSFFSHRLRDGSAWHSALHPQLLRGAQTAPFAVVGSTGRAVLLNLNRSGPNCLLQPLYTCRSDAFQVAFEPHSGDVIFSGARDGRIRSWDTRAPLHSDAFGSHATIMRLPSSCTWLHPLRDGIHLLAASLDGALRLFDRRQLPTEQSSSGGGNAAAASGGGGRGRGRGRGRGAPIGGGDFTPAAATTGSTDNTVAVRTYAGHCGTVRLSARPTVDDTEQTVFAGGSDGLVRAWHIRDGGSPIVTVSPFATPVSPNPFDQQQQHSPFGGVMLDSAAADSAICTSLLWMADAQVLVCGARRGIAALSATVPYDFCAYVAAWPLGREHFSVPLCVSL